VVSYVISTSLEIEEIYLTIVYSFMNKNALRLLLTKDRVTSICAPEESYIVLGTALGSLNLFDL